jgi:periplasmic protein CpxP/Spy
MFTLDTLLSSVRTRLFAATVIVAAASAVAQPSWAMPGGHGGPGMGMMHGRAMEHMLDAVNATPDQRSQIKAIAERAKADLQAQRDNGKALREQTMKLFAEPVVDANRAEALRQQMLQQHDQSSRRTMQAMIEVSRVLTPEQRKTLADRMARRGEMMQRHQKEREALGR